MTEETVSIIKYIKNGLIKISSKINLNNSENIIEYINSIKNETFINLIDIKNIRDSDTEVYLSEYYENRYLKNYGLIDISDYKKIDKFATLNPSIENKIVEAYFLDLKVKSIYHYTKYDSLLYIIKSKKFRMSCISSLNDRNEMMIAEPINRISATEPYHYKRIEAFNRRYILSCSLLKDNLNQWRLYGDDGKGVCIELEIDNKKLHDNFFIGKIIYGDKLLIELQKLVQNVYKTFGLVLILRSFNIWNSFIKSDDYKDEKEIRLLNLSKNGETVAVDWNINRYGILSKYAYFNIEEFPLTIKSIILGPKVNEAELNKGQLNQYIRELGYKGIKKIELSKIQNYR